MTQLIGLCSSGLLVSVFVGFGFTIGALIAREITGLDIKK